MYCLKSWKERQSTSTILLLFQNATIFIFYYVLNTIKSNLRQYDLLEHIKQDNILIVIFQYSVCVIYDLSEAGRST